MDELTVEEFSAVVFASVLVGGSCWASLPKTFLTLEPSKLEEVLQNVSPFLATKFNSVLVDWFCNSWRYLEPQTLLLMRYLKE